jgi:segregation and condensation protein A
MDIYDIPIARLAEDYITAIAAFPPGMDELSEFLVMAATLLEIKSKMLLPQTKVEGEPEEDPREALTQQLLAYARAQELAGKIGEITPREHAYAQPQHELLRKLTRDGEREGMPVMDLIPLGQLSDIFADVMKRVSDRVDHVRLGYGELPRDRFTVTEKIVFIAEQLVAAGRLSLVALFEACMSKREMIVTFLALLEMVRRGQIHATQKNTFEDVEIFTCK